MKRKSFTVVMPWHISEKGGGAEVQANYLALALAERGHEVSYICQTICTEKIDTKELRNGVQIFWLKASGSFQWLDQKKYLEPLNKIQPDFILQRLSSNVTYVLGQYCSKNSCKLIWFCTDNQSPFSNFHLNKFKTFSKASSLGVFKHAVFALSNKIMDYYRQEGMKKIDIAFSQNNFQKEQLKQNFNLESLRMISGHPIPLHSSSVFQKFKSKTILWCANFGKHKRPELFIELAKAFENSSYQFIMVGGHSDKTYVASLLKNKPGNLITTGQIPFEDALKYFDNTSILINTSKSEGFSNTYIQAWLRGIPTLVLGADPDNVIEDNRLGFNLQSIENIGYEIKNLLSDFSKYEIMSNRVVEYATKNHSIRIMTENFLNHLDEAVTLSK